MDIFIIIRYELEYLIKLSFSLNLIKFSSSYRIENIYILLE